jgi:hypothetical protein
LIRKFFPLDRNYLLEQAQFRTRERLLSFLTSTAMESYERVNNPLGLEDSFISKMRQFTDVTSIELDEFYWMLCGIYRFRHSNNQLELLWDGKDHLTRYEEEWTAVFRQWISEFCRDQLFVQAVLDLSVFLPSGSQPAMASNRMQHFLRTRFSLKIHKAKGIVAA